jgi:hypothetical protein
VTLPHVLLGPALWAELEDGLLRVSNGITLETLSLKRRADGRLEAGSRQQLVDRLAALAPRAPWQTRGPLWCALPARGVSLRRIPIPNPRPDDLRSVLALQVEARFPLPPDSLAWGWFSASDPSASEVTVAAVRSDALEELAAAFKQAGFEPRFTLASMVRLPGIVPISGRTLLLHLGAGSSEWTSFEGPLPAITRSVALGQEDVLARINKLLQGNPAEVEAQLRAWGGSESSAASDPRLESALREAFSPLTDSLKALPASDSATPERWELSGSSILAPVAARLLRTLRPGAAVTVHSESTSSAIDGLRHLTGAGSAAGAAPSRGIPLRLDLPNTKPAAVVGGLPQIPWPWVARIAALLVALLLFPYVEAVLGRPLLKRRLAALEKDRARLSEIDRRLEFVDQLAGNQPPYIEALYVIANAAPQGAKIDSVSMNRRGELSLSGYTQMPQQAVELRTRLVDSKYFSTVVLEEQTPIQGGPQRVNLRITAQWKGPAEREALQLGPVLPDPVKTNAPAGGKTNGPASTTPTPPGSAPAPAMRT